MADFVVDAHNDLLAELAFRSSESNPFAAHWLEPLARNGVRLQVCPFSVEVPDMPEAALRRALEQVAACRRAVRENPEYAMLLSDRGDLELLRAGDRVGLMLAMEGAEPLGYDSELADVFWDLGVRVFSLTWNRRNPFADGLAEPNAAGLSRRGAELVDRLVARGAILDLAHASERTYFDVLERSGDAAVMVSHAGCRAVFDTPRNLSDDQLRALAGRGGVLGVMGLPLTVDTAEPTVERMIDHIDHAVAVMGGEHVGLGPDFLRQLTRSGALRTDPGGTIPDSLFPAGMELDAALEGFAGPADYPLLADGLRRRGYAHERLDAVMATNFMRLFERALPESGGDQVRPMLEAMAGGALDLGALQSEMPEGPGLARLMARLWELPAGGEPPGLRFSASWEGISDDS